MATVTRPTATDTTTGIGLPRTGYDGIGPMVELVPGNGHANGNGHAPIPVNSLPRTGYVGNGRNGHYDAADESQQSPFSWAEFMDEEPVKPKGRGGKPKPASTSLFEWAVELEQARKAEPVGLSA